MFHFPLTSVFSCFLQRLTVLAGPPPPPQPFISSPAPEEAILEMDSLAPILLPTSQARPSIRSSQQHLRPRKKQSFCSHSALSAAAHHCVLGCFAQQPWVKDTQRSLQTALSHSGSVAMRELTSAGLCLLVSGALQADAATPKDGCFESFLSVHLRKFLVLFWSFVFKYSFCMSFLCCKRGRISNKLVMPPCLICVFRSRAY